MRITPRSVSSLTEQGEFLCLVDRGQGKSITHDAEAVIADGMTLRQLTFVRRHHAEHKRRMGG